MLVTLLFVIVLVIVLVHWAGLWLFLRAIQHQEWTAPTEAADGVPLPKTVVLLALRGGDPFLRRCLDGLLAQTHPNYAVRIILDHADDPAWPTVREALSAAHHAENRQPGIGTDDVQTITVTQHRKTCSLKCNSLIEAIETLDPTFEVVVTLDADTNPYPTWLAELIEPLTDDRFVAATGMRWYAPPSANAGSLVRYLWNAAAFVQMYFYKIPWGGSLAIRRSLFAEGLSESWSHALTDDTAIVNVARTSKKRIAYVPTVLMLNQETCRLSSFFFWVRRQMLNTKLYHPFWGVVLAQCAFISLPQIALVAAFIWFALQGDWPAAGQVFGSFLLYWFGVFVTLYPMEQGVRALLKRSGQVPPPTSLIHKAALLPAVPLTQLVYTLAVLSLYFQRYVDWRGVRYRLLANRQIELVEYRPYAPPAEVKRTTDSI